MKRSTSLAIGAALVTFLLIVSGARADVVVDGGGSFVTLFGLTPRHPALSSTHGSRRSCAARPTTSSAWAGIPLSSR
jgi:hypothetical protein